MTERVELPAFGDRALRPAPAPAGPQEPASAAQPRKIDNLTLIHGKTFLATTVAGDITPPRSTDVGLFHQDTRFLSYLALTVNGQRAVVLSSGTRHNAHSQIELTVANLVVSDQFTIPENTIHVRRDQLLADSFYDRLTFENFNLEPVDLSVELAFDADFVDVFQLRGSRRERMGTHSEPVAAGGTLTFMYRGRDDAVRSTIVEFDPAPAKLSGRVAHYGLHLPPLGRLVILVRVAMLVDGRQGPLAGKPFAETLNHRRHAFGEWTRDSTVFESSNDLFDACVNHAVADFHALQIPYREDADGASGHIIAAGIPWFATIFGRDSLIAAYQSLLLNPALAEQTLRYLARHQGTESDDWRDEEPGKILHELREGEMARCGEIPHSPYYGSIDSTPLFLIVLSETLEWTGDDALRDDLLPAAYRALEWLDRYGDLDGDGFIEYRCRSPRGLANQGWKDSWDANRHHDGTLAPPPIALCEVQGYAYDAKYRLSRLLRAAGDAQTADRLRREATDLARRFDRAFWMTDRAYYAMALDGEKRPLRVIASNPGHLLFSRIVSRERARQIASRLMRDDMFSGWGIRTLSSDEPTFNPLSYHRGSVWPHDNSLIVHGLGFYNLKREAEQIFTALFQAGLNFRNYSLPELFCGVQRRDLDLPVHFPVSCSPQAWASGSIFLMLQSMLGIRPNASRRELKVVNPVLPEWLDWLRLRRLRLGSSRVSLEFSRHHKRTFCNLLEIEGDRLNISIDFTKT